MVDSFIESFRTSITGNPLAWMFTLFLTIYVAYLFVSYYVQVLKLKAKKQQAEKELKIVRAKLDVIKTKLTKSKEELLKEFTSKKKGK